MVFIHPKILRDTRTAQYYSSEKYNYLRSKQMFARQTHMNERSTSPVLPELDVYFRGKRLDEIQRRRTLPQPEAAALGVLPEPGLRATSASTVR